MPAPLPVRCTRVPAALFVLQLDQMVASSAADQGLGYLTSQQALYIQIRCGMVVMLMWQPAPIVARLCAAAAKASGLMLLHSLRLLCRSPDAATQAEEEEAAAVRQQVLSSGCRDALLLGGNWQLPIMLPAFYWCAWIVRCM